MQPVSQSLNVDLRRLGVLREVDRRGSLSRTAEALHLTPSAVSQQLSSLSTAVGAPLLERHGRGVRLTGQARLLLEHADVIGAQWERARADLANWGDGRRGRVAVGAFGSAITGLLPHALEHLRRSSPDIDVGVTEAGAPDVFTLLDGGQIDLAVAVDFAGAPPRTDVRYVRTDLMVDVLDLALPRGHRLAGGGDVPWLGLATETWIVGSPDSCCGAITRAVCAAAGFTPHIGHAVDDWTSLAAMVGSGLGIALVPRLVQPFHRDGLVVRTTAAPAPTRHVFAAVRAGSELTPVLRSVLDQLGRSADAVTREGSSRRHRVPDSSGTHELESAHRPQG